MIYTSDVLAAASHLWQTDVQPASNHKMSAAVVQPEEDY
jgi:hypothetical protein